MLGRSSAFAVLLFLLGVAYPNAIGHQEGAASGVNQRVDPGRLARIDQIVADAIAHGKLPGAVVLVGLGDEVVYRKAFGARAVELLMEAKFDHMVAFHPPDIVAVPLDQVVGRTRTVPPDFDVVRTARAMGISMGD